MNKTSFQYRTNGDGSTSVRVTLPNGTVYVHTNKCPRALEKVLQRYRNAVSS